MMDRKSQFNRSKLEDLDDDENFSQKVDEREEYDLVGINIEEFPLDLSTCILKAFACLFLFESCSMNLTDLFLTFKSPKDMFAFQVKKLTFLLLDSYCEFCYMGELLP